jgi:hypothetical protein
LQRNMTPASNKPASSSCSVHRRFPAESTARLRHPQG